MRVARCLGNQNDVETLSYLWETKEVQTQHVRCLL